MRLLIMGPQGVGKGTQAALLSEHYNIPAISTGDIFRYNLKNQTELGKQVQVLHKMMLRMAGFSTVILVTLPRFRLWI